MRQLTAGLTIGFLFGAALTASAGYFDHNSWTTLSALEQLDYVAGVTDTIETVNSAIHGARGLHTAVTVKLDAQFHDGMAPGHMAVAPGAAAMPAQVDNEPEREDAPADLAWRPVFTP